MGVEWADCMNASWERRLCMGLPSLPFSPPPLESILSSLVPQHGLGPIEKHIPFLSPYFRFVLKKKHKVQLLNGRTMPTVDTCHKQSTSKYWN